MVSPSPEPQPLQLVDGPALGGLDVEAVEEVRVDRACRRRHRPRRRSRRSRGRRRAAAPPASPAGRTCGRNRGRAGRAPGSRRWRRCRSPSGRSWRPRPAGQVVRRERVAAAAARCRSPASPAVSISASLVPPCRHSAMKAAAPGSSAASSAASGWSGAMREEGGAEQRVGPGGEDLERRRRGRRSPKRTRAPAATADPVALHQPDLLGPAVEPVEGVQQLRRRSR